MGEGASMIERDEIQDKEPLVWKLWAISMLTILVISLVAWAYAGFAHGFVAVWVCVISIRLFWVFFFGNDTR